MKAFFTPQMKKIPNSRVFFFNYRLNPFLGFTLVEIMIVVALIAILASIAYPSYQEVIKRTRRVDAQRRAFELANKQEEYLLNTRSYRQDSSSTDFYNLVVNTQNDVSSSECDQLSWDSNQPKYEIVVTAKVGGETFKLCSDGNKIGNW